jgi:acetyltransferase
MRNRGMSARVLRLRPDATLRGFHRFAIRPFPEEFEEWVSWQGRPLLLRPIRPEDGTQHMESFKALSPEDIRYRVFIKVRDLQISQLARLTQIGRPARLARACAGSNHSLLPRGHADALSYRPVRSEWR